MSGSQRGTHTITSHGSRLTRKHMHDWVVLLLLAVFYIFLNKIEPFHRHIGEDMTADISYPYHEDLIPMWAVPVYAILLPCVIFLINYWYKRDVYDLHHAMLGLFYASLVTGVITDTIKVSVGRPRPNFMARCFNQSKWVFNTTEGKFGNVLCTNDAPNAKALIKEGYKSFPSGHTSWSFAGLGFLALYLSGKIRAFDRRGHAAKVCLVLLPYLCAALVGVTRVDDYWHHWTDVFAGGILGTVVSAICYLQFFPFPHETNGWAPHEYFRMLQEAHPSSSLEMGSIHVV